MKLIDLLNTNNNYEPEIPAPGKLAGTDKEVIHKYITEFYEEHFQPYQEKSITLLEIGASHGGSLMMWHDYFTNGTILSVDSQNTLMPDMVKYPKIKVFFEDGYTDSFVNRMPQLDIVIDDGPHTSTSQIECIKRYFPKLNPGGILVIEDIADISLTHIFKNMVPEHEHLVVDTRDKYGRYDNIIFAVWK